MVLKMLTTSLAALATAAAPAPAQGIPSNSCIDCTKMAVQATKVVVSTPYPANSADSATAILLGNALRQKLDDKLGDDWQVVSRFDMNRNLASSGYPPDAILPYDQARQLAGFLQGRVVVTTGLGKDATGHYVASTLMRGRADDVGQLVKLTQEPGQNIGDFAGKIADKLGTLFKAYQVARVCTDQQVTNQQKAIDAANKALKIVPDYGYAEYCLARIAQQTDSVGDAALQHYLKAAEGDPQSLKAVNELAMIHQIRHDSAAVVADFQKMITIAPTNRPLAEAAVKVFHSYHHPEAASQVVDAQMRLDPTNPEWPDLKGNACLAAAFNQQSDTNTAQDSAEVHANYACAFTAFAQEFDLDSTRADSTFFEKVIFVAPTSNDTLTWARAYAQKYPSSATPLRYEAAVLTAQGKTDSALAVARRLLAADPTAYQATLGVVIQLLNAGNDSAAIALGPLMHQSSDSAAVVDYASVLMAFADSASQRAADTTKPHNERDDSLMVHLGQAIAALGAPGTPTNDFGNYYVVRGLAPGLTRLSQEVRTAKACATLKVYEKLLAQLEPALEVLSRSSNQGIAGYGNGLLAPVQNEVTVMQKLEPTVCKP